jgi:hypothetical protein
MAHGLVKSLTSGADATAPRGQHHGATSGHMPNTGREADLGRGLGMPDSAFSLLYSRMRHFGLNARFTSSPNFG